MRRSLSLSVPLTLAALAACQDVREPIAIPADEPLAPLYQASASEALPGQYIVVFRDAVADVQGLAQGLTQAHGGSLRFTYEHALRGFAARLPEAAVQALRNHPHVAYIEQDQVMRAVGSQSPATWGLDRIDQRGLPLNNRYDYDQTGAGVNAYIIDTGILLSHVEFTGRLIPGFDAVTSGGNANDCNGHGTHVAGSVGGTLYGVAKQARLSPIRVLACNGSGSNSGVIAGVEWVTANHAKPAVANMSLGGGASAALDDAVRSSIAAGVSYAVAAGNGDFIGRQQAACNYSPARVRQALTVGATNNNDAKASWSNYGECVDIFAPGVSITSAWYTSSTATNTISGTSMASPHVAGVAALYLQANPNASPAQVFSAISEASTKNIVTSSSTTNNHLLYSRFGGGVTPPPPGEPLQASFTYSCANGPSCSFTDTSTGAPTGWSWSFPGGTPSSASTANASTTYNTQGDKVVTLTVSRDGQTSSVQQTITCRQQGPNLRCR